MGRAGGYGTIVTWYGLRAFDADEVLSVLCRARDRFLYERARVLDQLCRERDQLVRQQQAVERRRQQLTALIDAGERLLALLIAQQEGG